MTSRGVQLRGDIAALALVAAAVVVRFLFDPILHDRAPFLFSTIAVLVAGAWFGLRAGILASVASIAAGVFFFVEPRFAILPMAWDDVGNLFAFALLSAGILVLVDLLGRAKVREIESRAAQLASETRELRLIDAAQDYAIYELDREGHILTWNKGAERLKGWKAEEVIGKPYNILHTPESRARNAPGRELKIAAETGRFEEEAPRMRKDGTIFAAHVTLFPLRDDRGDVTGFVKVTRDISDRSKAGKAILESRRRMEAIVQSAMDAIITIDEHHNVVLFNPAAEMMFGYSADEILGRPVALLVPERMRTGNGDQVWRFFESGENRRPVNNEVTLCGLRKNGEEFPVEASVSQVTVGGERVETVILRDITERKANEEARSLLAREVDHRAKNALAVAQALVGLTKAETIEDFADTIRGRIAALGRAHSLLSQSQWRGAPLDQLIRDELQPYAKDSQLTIEGPPVSCSASSVQSLSLLFHELATNAVKHGALGRDAGHVTVGWKVDEDQLQISWREEGGPKVVAPKREGFGTKLLRQVAGRQLDAKLEFEWKASGMRVRISLPQELFVVAKPHPGETDAHEGVARAEDGNERRILVVEDEELVALELSVELSRLGWAVIGPASTLREAEALISKPVDAAVLDVNIRGRSVYPLAETLAERRVPFLFCTGYEMADPEGRFPNVPVIRKPAHPTAVSAALSDLLKTHVQ